MANKVKVALNREGVRQLLCSSEMMGACKAAAETIRGNYGGDTELEEYKGRNRVNVAVVAPMDKAQQNNDLLKAVHE
jgi:hypothetical protein